MKVGLALAGGGAKGAYHVGVIKALEELNVVPDCIAGASIGALNGAMLAATSDMSKGYSRLHEVWSALAQESPLKLSSKLPITMPLILASGAAFRSMPILSAVLSASSDIAEKFGYDTPLSQSEILESNNLVKLLEEYLSPADLRKGIPMYASVFESSGAVSDLFGIALASFGIKNTDNSKYIHIQEQSDANMQNALLASAALPLLYRQRVIDGKKYSDGGQGDWQGESGNIPVEPLIDAGCDLVIVAHLSNGSMWDRSRYPDANIIEVRPQSSITRNSGLLSGAKDLLSFDSKKIPSWMDQGYTDAIHTLKRVFGAVEVNRNLQRSQQGLVDSLENLSKPDVELESAMSRLD